MIDACLAIYPSPIIPLLSKRRDLIINFSNMVSNGELDVQRNPNLVSVLQIQSRSTLSNPDVKPSLDATLQRALVTFHGGAKARGSDTSAKRDVVDISGDLGDIRRTEVNSYWRRCVTYLEWRKTKAEVLDALFRDWGKQAFACNLTSLEHANFLLGKLHLST